MISVRLLLLPFLALSAKADDWPQFLGVNRDGISRETALNTNWDAKEPPVVWKKNVFVGASSMAVVGKRLYTLGNDRSKDVVHCLDAGTGNLLWKQVYRCKNESRNFNGGSATTPTVHDGRVYTLSHQGNLNCWKADHGEKIWEADLVADYGGVKPQWAWSGSPLVVGEMVIVEPGGEGTSRIALDRKTGQVLWKQGSDAVSYASPITWSHENRAALALFNAAGLIGVNAADGAEIFRFPWKTQFDVNASTPLYHEGAFFHSSGYGSGAAVIDIRGASPVVRWQNKNLSLHLQNSVYLNGKIYAVSGDNRGEKGQLKCLDFLTGEVAWAERMGQAYGQIVVVAGKLIVLTDQGEVILVEPDPVKYVERGRFQAVAGAPAWSAPAFSNGLLYVRQNLGDLVCLDLRP